MIDAIAHLAAWLQAAGIEPAKVRVVLEFDDRGDAHKADAHLTRGIAGHMVLDQRYLRQPPTINGVRYDFRAAGARLIAVDHLRAALRELER